MAKAAHATIKIHLEPELKKDVDSIFKSLGLSTTEAIRLFYQKVKASRGLPFKYEMPNEETLEVMRDTDAGKNLTQWDSVGSYFTYIEKNAKA